MSRTPFNKVFKAQNKTLVPATFKRGVISGVNATARTVNVTFSENTNVVVRSIPLAKHIVASTVIPGQNCRVDLFNETVNGQMCVAYIF